MVGLYALHMLYTCIELPKIMKSNFKHKLSIKKLFIKDTKVSTKSRRCGKSQIRSPQKRAAGEMPRMVASGI